MNAKPLPREEWNFPILDKEEISRAFYYEYGRASYFVKNEVAKMRAARPAGRPDIWPYPAIADRHRLHKVLHWLAVQESYFPKTPWLLLKEKTIAEIQKERAEARSKEAQINATLPSGTKFCVGGRAGKPGDPVKSIEWMVEALRYNFDLRIGGAWFEHLWRGDVKAYQVEIKRRAEFYSKISEGELQLEPEYGGVRGTIDWRATDKEIITKFSWFLKRARPAQFKDNAKTPLGQRGFDIAFPFRENSALNWLGVFRRYNATKITWRDFFRLYKNRDMNRGEERAHQEDYRKAEKILDWFNTGTPLLAKDFK
ncbi:MAG: hypothetical protein ACREFE_01775 [Limisphaerales bacterium]